MSQQLLTPALQLKDTNGTIFKAEFRENLVVLFMSQSEKQNVIDSQRSYNQAKAWFSG